MEKSVLKQYIDACELIKDTKAEIKAVKRQRRTISQDIVKGSMTEFPYAAQSFHIEGLSYSVIKEPDELDNLEEILAVRIVKAEEIKTQVEMWLNMVPQRMQRIIKYKIFEEMTWAQVAIRMGRKATPDGVRKEYENFMKAV